MTTIPRRPSATALINADWAVRHCSVELLRYHGFDGEADELRELLPVTDPTAAEAAHEMIVRPRRTVGREILRLVPADSQVLSRVWLSLKHAQYTTRALRHSQDVAKAASYALSSGMTDPVARLVAAGCRVVEVLELSPTALEIAVGLRESWSGTRSELLEAAAALS